LILITYWTPLIPVYTATAHTVYFRCFRAYVQTSLKLQHSVIIFRHFWHLRNTLVR